MGHLGGHPVLPHARHWTQLLSQEGHAASEGPLITHRMNGVQQAGKIRREEVPP